MDPGALFIGRWGNRVGLVVFAPASVSPAKSPNRQYSMTPFCGTDSQTIDGESNGGADEGRANGCRHDGACESASSLRWGQFCSKKYKMESYGGESQGECNEGPGIEHSEYAICYGKKKEASQEKWNHTVGKRMYGGIAGKREEKRADEKSRLHQGTCRASRRVAE